MYCIDSTVDEPIMLLNKHIGFDANDGMGIDGAEFQAELLQLDTLGKKRIQVWINSPGGIVTEGYNIYSSILKSNTPVDTYCCGAAASIAGVIFQAGRKRIMADYGWLMFHNPFGGDNSDMLKTMKGSITTMIEQRSGMNEAEVAEMMRRSTFIRPDEALQLKLCDSIDSSEKLNTKYLKKITDQMEFYHECNLVLNSVLNPVNIMDATMTKVTMRLKLNDAATPENIIAAIDEIQNRATKAEEDLATEKEKAQDKAKADEDELAKLKAKFEKAESDLAKAKKDYEDCKSKLDAMEEDKKAAEDSAKEEKAKMMVEDYAKVGRIKNEASIKLPWITMAKVDFDGTKAMIEALPLNKVAVTIPVENKLGAGELPTTAMGLTIKNRLIREGKFQKN
jgi:ATP-dependent Clp protease protease subunit